MEAWARTATRAYPVYACLVEELQPPSKYGLQDVLLIVWAAQHRPQVPEVHYFRCRLGRLEYVGSTPFGNDHEEKLFVTTLLVLLRLSQKAFERKRRAEEAWGLIRDWLKEKGFEVREGVVAYPRELKLFEEGWPGFLKYDKEQKRYVRVRS